MVNLQIGPKTVDLPYTIRIPDVTDKMFDELVDEDTRAELLDGVMIVHSPASLAHDDLGGFLRPLMRCYAEETDLGKVLGPDSIVHLATCRKFAPDLYFLKKHRVPRRWPIKRFKGSPDLAAEILSSSNWREDLEDKRPAYRRAKVGEIWLVDPKHRRVIVDRKDKKGYTTTVATKGRLHSQILQGFWIEVDWLWTEPLPKVMTCLREILG